MMDWTDRHCRYFHRLLAPHARLYTEMLHAQAVYHRPDEHLLGFDPSERPLALQVGGSDPALLAHAARIGAEWGYDEINLNVGCPSDRVQSGRFGACLMREPARVAECVAAMQAAVPIPVTVKCRIGVDEQDEDAHFQGFVEQVAQAGCRVFIVHARKAWLKGLSPQENREIPPLNYARVQRLKRDRPDLTVVLNGGIVTSGQALEQLATCDGVMLGRSAYHDPYVLAQLEQALFGTPAPDPEEVLLGMAGYVRARLAGGERLHRMARHWAGLFQGRPGARRWRRALSEQFSKPSAGWDAVLLALHAYQAASSEGHPC